VGGHSIGQGGGEKGERGNKGSRSVMAQKNERSELGKQKTITDCRGSKREENTLKESQYTKKKVSQGRKRQAVQERSKVGLKGQKREKHSSKTGELETLQNNSKGVREGRGKGCSRKL